MKTHFVYDPEGNGYDEFESEEKALKEAEEAIQGYLIDGWMEDVIHVTCGQITHRATQTDLKQRPCEQELDENGCDQEGTFWDGDWDYMCNYEIKPIKPPRSGL